VSRKASFQITSCFFFVTCVSVKILSALERSGQNRSFRSYNSLYGDAYSQCLIYKFFVLENILNVTMMFTVIALYTKLNLGEFTHFNLDV